MKTKFLLTTIVSMLTACVFGQSQVVSWEDVKNGRMIQRLPLEGNKLTLTITNIPAIEKVNIYEENNIANKINGTINAKNTIFILDDLLEDFSGEDSLKIIINNAGKNKSLATFLLISTASGFSTSKTLLKDEPAIAFYDAQAVLNAYISSHSFPLDIFRKYRSGVTETELNQNPFIVAFNRTVIISGKPVKTVSNSLLTGALANLSGIDVTKYVQATADFLRDRIREELAIAFIEKFKAAINSMPELNALLPKTYNAFTTSDPFKAPSMGQTYKAAFQEDLENFINNFELFIDTTSIKRYEILKLSQAFSAFRIAYHAIDMSANSFHPIEIFEILDSKFGADLFSSRVKEINIHVSLLNILSQNLRKKHISITENAKAWISPEDLKKFNPDAILLFWALLYEQKPQVFEGLVINSKRLHELIIEGSGPVQLYIKQFVILVNNIDDRINNFKQIVKDTKSEIGKLKDLAVKEFVANTDKLVDVSDFIFNLPYFKNEAGVTYYKSEYYTKWRPIIVDVIEVTKGVFIKDYAKISVNAINLAKNFSKLNGDTLFSPGFLKNYSFYSNFIVDAINAKDADAVKAVLNRYAKPVGSYRVKRKTAFSMSLNSYPGLYFGWEKYKDSSNRTFGVTAPIGMSFNWGDFPGNGWSSSIFVNAIDIGAALSYRWTNDTLDLPQKVTLGQIFSPGAFFVLGFPNLPISAKFGAQYVSQLRTITKNGNVVGEINPWRLGISIAVDIPVFNFYNRSR